MYLKKMFLRFLFLSAALSMVFVSPGFSGGSDDGERKHPSQDVGEGRKTPGSLRHVLSREEESREETGSAASPSLPEDRMRGGGTEEEEAPYVYPTTETVEVDPKLAQAMIKCIRAYHAGQKLDADIKQLKKYGSAAQEFLDTLGRICPQNLGRLSPLEKQVKLANSANSQEFPFPPRLRVLLLREIVSQLKQHPHACFLAGNVLATGTASHLPPQVYTEIVMTFFKYGSIKYLDAFANLATWSEQQDSPHIKERFFEICQELSVDAQVIPLVKGLTFYHMGRLIFNNQVKSELAMRDLFTQALAHFKRVPKKEAKEHKQVIEILGERLCCEGDVENAYRAFKLSGTPRSLFYKGILVGESNVKGYSPEKRYRKAKKYYTCANIPEAWEDLLGLDRPQGVPIESPRARFEELLKVAENHFLHKKDKDIFRVLAERAFIEKLFTDPIVRRVLEGKLQSLIPHDKVWYFLAVLSDPQWVEEDEAKVHAKSRALDYARAGVRARDSHAIVFLSQLLVREGRFQEAVDILRSHLTTPTETELALTTQRFVGSISLTKPMGLRVNIVRDELLELYFNKAIVSCLFADSNEQLEAMHKLCSEWGEPTPAVHTVLGMIYAFGEPNNLRAAARHFREALKGGRYNVAEWLEGVEEAIRREKNLSLQRKELQQERAGLRL